jgi:acylphosphatase
VRSWALQHGAALGRNEIPAKPRERERLRKSFGVPADRIRRRVIVHGRVQGVFFRDSVRERARAHGVSGWICNRSDGAVEAVLEGRPDHVERVVRFCKIGPRQASVDQIDVTEEQPEGLSGFEIR